MTNFLEIGRGIPVRPYVCLLVFLSVCLLVVTGLEGGLILLVLGGGGFTTLRSTVTEDMNIGALCRCLSTLLPPVLPSECELCGLAVDPNCFPLLLLLFLTRTTEDLSNSLSVLSGCVISFCGTPSTAVCLSVVGSEELTCVRL